MFERSFQDIGDDLHVSMAMPRKSLSRLNPILVENAQLAKAHVGGVVVVRERKSMAAIQPVQFAGSAVLGFAHRQHLHLLHVLGLKALPSIFFPSLAVIEAAIIFTIVVV